MELRIVSISDGYIEFLRNHCANVLDNKYETRKFTRKYVGIVLKVNNLNYYIPLSSPKDYDYLSDGTIRKSNMFYSRMAMNVGNGKMQLYGKLMYKNMIPVPDSAIVEYDIDSESDEKYKAIVLNEKVWITLRIGEIVESANRIYKFRKNPLNIKDPRIEKIVDFDVAERACALYIELVK